MPTVSTAHEMGWSSLANGDLLDAAEALFDVFVTTDQNLRYQQNLSGRKMAIVVLPFASWPKPQEHLPAIVAAIEVMMPGDYVDGGRILDAYNPSPEDLTMVESLPAEACPRRYCWWWRSLSFDWQQSASERCTGYRKKNSVTGNSKTSRVAVRTRAQRLTSSSPEPSTSTQTESTPANGCRFVTTIIASTRVRRY